jgi:hypothetical protein
MPTKHANQNERDTIRFTYPDGRTEERPAAAGEAIWRDPVTHSVDNIGKTEAHAIAIDLKKN